MMKFISIVPVLLLLSIHGNIMAHEFPDTSGINEPDTIFTGYTSKHLGLILGYHLHNNQYLEIGLGIKSNKFHHHPFSLIYGISNEFRLHRDVIWGLKAGIWAGGGVAGLNMGLNMINYTDFRQNSFRIRPEIGFGFDFFRVVYGYNLPIGKSGLEGINTHNFALNLILNVKRLNGLK